MMKRRTRRLVANFVLFIIAICVVTYFTQDGSDDRTFDWTRVRYQAASAKLPGTLGICPGLSSNTKPVLVVARVAAEDQKWLEELEDKYHLCIYTNDAPLNADSRFLQVPANHGKEAMSYLTFLIDNYEKIPPAGVVFVHGSRRAWHNDDPDYDNASLLRQLNVSAAIEEPGYHNLRCDWSTSTCSRLDAPAQGSMEVLARAKLEPWNKRAASDAALPGVLSEVFGPDHDVHLGRSHAVRSQCCAQFAASRDALLQHSRAEYIALRQWILERKSDFPGRVLSYIWHILFLSTDHVSSNGGLSLHRLNTLACPTAADCYCRLYNRCNLEGCVTPGHCFGQYVLPENLRLQG